MFWLNLFWEICHFLVFLGGIILMIRKEFDGALCLFVMALHLLVSRWRSDWSKDRKE